MIDVASGEYGYEYVEKMISQVDNGRCINWIPNASDDKYDLERENVVEKQIHEFEAEIDPKQYMTSTSSWEQFCILYKRRTLQMWRDSVSFLMIICKRLSIFTFKFLLQCRVI